VLAASDHGDPADCDDHAGTTLRIAPVRVLPAAQWSTIAARRHGICPVGRPILSRGGISSEGIMDTATDRDADRLILPWDPDTDDAGDPWAAWDDIGGQG
jgi:hypothetical protein